MEQFATLGPIGAIIFVISAIGLGVVLIKPKILRNKQVDPYGILFIKTGGFGFVLILVSIFRIDVVFIVIFIAAVIYVVYGMN